MDQTQTQSTLSVDEIYCQTIDATQAIQTQYLYDFIQTNTDKKSSSNFYATYVQNAHCYAVIAVDDCTKIQMLEPQYLESQCDGLYEQYHLFITPKYFALFCKTNLIYCKTYNETMSHHDIEQYTQQIFQISKFDVRVFDIQEYMKIQQKHVKTKPIAWLKQKSLWARVSTMYKIYMMILLIFMVYPYENKNNASQYLVHKKNYDQFTRSISCTKSMIVHINKYFLFIHKEKLTLKHIKATRTTATMDLQSDSKEKIYNFINRVSSNIYLEHITFNAKHNIYNARVKFDLF
ncbi:MAG: hypothetical protein U9N30_00450 [Campylobacterota bacterium]|nr:hypothetical protein [Campylobacterota bacterium]